MAVTILIPTPLRRFIGGNKTVEVVADTVQGALVALAEQSPDLRRQLFDDQDRLRSFVNVFLGDQHIRTPAHANQPVAVRDGDELTLLVAIAGGAHRGSP